MEPVDLELPPLALPQRSDGHPRPPVDIAMEELIQLHHASPKGRGSRASVQIGHEHLGRRLVTQAFARLIVEMSRKCGQVAL